MKIKGKYDKSGQCPLIGGNPFHTHQMVAVIRGEENVGVVEHSQGVKFIDQCLNLQGMKGDIQSGILRLS